MKYLNIGRYAPDQPDLKASVSRHVINVIPITHHQGAGVTYGPINALSVFSDPLNGKCKGAFSFFDNTSEGLTQIFAGTTDKLFHMNASSAPSFTDVSSPTDTYNVNEDDFWEFANFGDRVIAVNSNNDTQTFVVGVNTEFSDLSATAPRGKHVAVVKEWTVIGNTIDTIDGVQTQRIHWSGIADPTSWPDPFSPLATEQQRDFQNLAGDTGAIQAIIPGIGNADAIIFSERGIHSMNYVGIPSIFDIQPTEGARGTPASQSVIKVGNIAYYLGEDGFYKFDGNSSIPIGAELVDETFFKETDPTFRNKIVGASDPVRRLVYWAYPSTQSIDGSPDKLLIYNWHIKEWSVADFNIDYIFPTNNFSRTLESFDVDYPSAEDIPASLDSLLWTGNSQLLGAFGPDFSMAYFTGPFKEAVVQTEEYYPLENRKTNILGSRPHIQGETKNAQVSVGIRNTSDASLIFSAFKFRNPADEWTHRSSGRYFTFKIKIPAGEVWTQIHGIEILVKLSGRR